MGAKRARCVNLIAQLRQENFAVFKVYLFPGYTQIGHSEPMRCDMRRTLTFHHP